jgi:ubiquinone/menaquinone biosynthesis C-methylase UbiE
MALLIVNFIPDARKATSEMCRVTRSGGVVATANWDGSRANELVNGFFWNAAKAIDPSVKRPSEKQGAYNSAETLSDLLNGGGLKDVAVRRTSPICQ